MKALVLGAGGQLGTELVRLLGPESAVTHDELSITDRAAVDALIDERRPELVFNCAAYNAVDKAETEPHVALLVNRDGPANVARACAARGARFVHFSTNFVFDGEMERGYVEPDHPRPLGAYGRSKLEGERLVLETGSRVLVARTAAVYGGPQSFPMRILDQARSGRPLRVVSDQTVNPTYARDLARAAFDLVEAGETGLVHVVAGGCCAWDELARAALAEAGVDAPVESVATGAYPAAARRPRNGCLSSIRTAPLRHWREALRAALNP